VDTEVEIPRVARQASIFLDQVEQWSAEQNLSISVFRLQPPPEESYWGLLIGKGYTTPTHFFRWCVNRLKIKPVRRFLNSCESDVVVLLGSRKEESETRNRSLAHRGVGFNDNRWGRFDGAKHARCYYPILDWTTPEVWEFLLKSGPPWGGQYSKLFGLYWDALDECMFKPDTRSFSCNGRRFGCWTCTVVKRDRTLENLALSDYKGLTQELLAFKQYLIDMSNNPINRCGITRKGTTGPGPFTLPARKEIYLKLKELERRVGMRFLTQEQEAFIHKAWQEDELAGVYSMSRFMTSRQNLAATVMSELSSR
jgi:DNA sulfur modification protein DndC